MINKTSMTYWLPRIERLGIPIPKTVLVESDFGEGGDYLSKGTHVIVEQEAKKMGFPCFIKTDLCAGKHSYVDTCFVDSLPKLHQNLERLRDDNFCCDQIFSHIAIREFIELAWKFKAFNGLPIAPERRYFIEGGKVCCHHPYWPRDAIEFFNIGSLKNQTRKEKVQELKEKYLPILDEMNQETPDEIKLLTIYAEQVSEVLPEYWSVDFALGSNGIWYLIDMAEGDKSYHDDDCIQNQKRNEL